ncbi:MAG: hypothetical protein N2038_10340 [Geminicoccaceae bacterium]|nr:hypothetical protein [Geminicoccaceae bacterium]MDW8369218.1 hypothetical protein [Geminicoccaceae bacterium]
MLVRARNNVPIDYWLCMLRSVHFKPKTCQPRIVTSLPPRLFPRIPAPPPITLLGYISRLVVARFVRVAFPSIVVAA